MTKIRTREPQSEPKPEYVYHWDRILGALSALFLVLGLSIYGVYSWLTAPVAPTSVEVEQIPELEAMPVEGVPQYADSALGSGAEEVAEPTPPSPETKPRIAGAAQRAADGLLASEQGSAPTAADPTQLPLQGKAPVATSPPPVAALTSEAAPERPSEPPTSPPAITEEPTKQTPTRIAIPEPADGSSSPAEEALVADTEAMPADASSDAAVRETETSPAQSTDPTPEPAASQAIPDPEIAEEEKDEGPTQSSNPAIPSAAVKRFSLAKSVVDREPRGDLSDTQFNAKGLSSVSSFSEVIGLQGEVLVYRWLHDSKEVLEVRVPVRANRWRSHSTKRISSGMKGSWRVELRDSKGTLLGSIDFVI
jgi:hypothetical protein